MKKFPFEKGQYHQCIPNPHRPDEFITVMLVNRSLEQAKFDKSVNSLFRSTQGRVQSKTYEEYDIVDPDEINQEGGNGEDDGEESTDNLQDSEEEIARKSLKPGLFHEENLAEQVDEIEGIENKEFAKLKKKIWNPENIDA